MTHDEIHYTREAMAKFGGSFMSGLGIALRSADPINTNRLFAAFPEAIDKYGPGTHFYAAVSQKEAA